MIKGMELSEKFYIEFGEKIFDDDLLFLKERVAFGLVGEGSECYGFDDEISRDHDYGPSFCMWLTDEDFKQYGQSIMTKYSELPAVFMGLETRLNMAQTLGRVGVLRTTEFYKSLIGRQSAPIDNLEWIRIKEFQLAAASNGKIFKDELGEFSHIRESLIAYYPEDVRLKRLAAAVGNMAQSGQYNYLRCLRRNEVGGAFLMLSRFVESCLKAIYLLNREYKPFDKWVFRKMQELPLVKDTQRKLLELVSAEDNKVWRIEEICDDIRVELARQNLSLSKDDFLITHAVELMHNIDDVRIRSMNMLQDEI